MTKLTLDFNKNFKSMITYLLLVLGVGVSSSCRRIFVSLNILANLQDYDTLNTFFKNTVTFKTCVCYTVTWLGVKVKRNVYRIKKQVLQVNDFLKDIYVRFHLGLSFFGLFNGSPTFSTGGMVC